MRPDGAAGLLNLGININKILFGKAGPSFHIQSQMDFSRIPKNQIFLLFLFLVSFFFPWYVFHQLLPLPHSHSPTELVYVAPASSCVEILIPRVVVLGGEGFGRRLGQEDAALMNGISTCMKETPEKSLTPSTQRKDSH